MTSDEVYGDVKIIHDKTVYRYKSRENGAAKNAESAEVLDRIYRIDRIVRGCFLSRGAEKQRDLELGLFPEGSANFRVPAKRGFRVREARGGAEGAGKGPRRPARTCSRTDAGPSPGLRQQPAPMPNGFRGRPQGPKHKLSKLNHSRPHEQGLRYNQPRIILFIL